MYTAVLIIIICDIYHILPLGSRMSRLIMQWTQGLGGVLEAVSTAVPDGMMTFY
jgi:hypothetical protein